MRHVCLVRLVGIVRTWALMRGGMSRSLFSIFARTLDRFILFLVGSEDMAGAKVVCGAGGNGNAVVVEVKSLVVDLIQS